VSVTTIAEVMWSLPWAAEGRIVDPYAVRKGTVQHEVLEGREARVGPGDALAVDINCRVDAGKSDTPIWYEIVASLEIATTIWADIYAEVRHDLQVELR
jgi:hypothetical protein